jgi:hypothetical protein
MVAVTATVVVVWIDSFSIATQQQWTLLELHC